MQTVRQARWLAKSLIIFTLVVNFVVVIFVAFRPSSSDILRLAHSSLADLLNAHKTNPPQQDDLLGSVSTECQRRQQVASLDIWDAARTKSNSLSDDKFTIALQTYRRPDSLNRTLTYLTTNKIDSLHEIVVIWNDVATTPPEDFTSPQNVRVRYRASPQNSMNQKFWPDPDYATQAILLHDDDIHYSAQDLDFVFQTWRRHGRGRITGTSARCVQMTEKGSWHYNYCQDQIEYSMVLTNLAFTHISFLEYYSSTDPLMTRIRNFVDEVTNCDDLAYNFITTMLTCQGPLQVSGVTKTISYPPPKGISTTPGHLKLRDKCIDTFYEWFGNMPLMNTTERIVHGALVT